MKVLSLCTEFGSEVQAFTDRGHEVETLGIVGNVTYLQDVRTFHPTKQYDFISAHPDCKQFSKANWRAGKCKDRNPDLSIVQACQRIIKEVNPRWHMIENPEGCMRYFIGKPDYIIRYGDFGHYCQKPTHLWGVLPFFQSSMINKVVKGYHNATAYTNGTKKASERALLPYALSLALCIAMEKELEE